jgi:hypothetical protein
VIFQRKAPTFLSAFAFAIFTFLYSRSAGSWADYIVYGVAVVVFTARTASKRTARTAFQGRHLIGAIGIEYDGRWSDTYPDT